MNNKGQLLLFDIVLAIFLLFMVVTAMLYVIEQENDYTIDYDEARTTLDLLSSAEVHDVNLLEALSDDDEAAKEVLSNIMSDKKYTLKDLTLNKTLSRQNSTGYTDVITARRKVSSHEYELSLYV